ncbi:MAG TPA: type II 3-dehydroquinate dehydratase [Xanthobacteraceae bacterium]|jgi:3-dehydroquinate dehydratase II|nr:type II 3-dehydroquinate dehydratase [Xanthobacteraceae bacterium]
MASLVYVLNGPNLNLLGTREPDVYGSDTLADIEKLCRAAAAKHGLEVVFRQTNVEGELVNWLQEARTKAAGVLLNAGAYTHTSVAILDAIRATTMPVIEVHLSNPFAREQFRHHSFVSPAAKGLICGFGAHSYVLAIDALAGVLRTAKA